MTRAVASSVGELGPRARSNSWGLVRRGSREVTAAPYQNRSAALASAQVHTSLAAAHRPRPGDTGSAMMRPIASSVGELQRPRSNSRGLIQRGSHDRTSSYTRGMSTSSARVDVPGPSQRSLATSVGTASHIGRPRASDIPALGSAMARPGIASSMGELALHPREPGRPRSLTQRHQSSPTHSYARGPASALVDGAGSPQRSLACTATSMRSFTSAGYERHRKTASAQIDRVDGSPSRRSSASFCTSEGERSSTLASVRCASGSLSRKGAGQGGTGTAQTAQTARGARPPPAPKTSPNPKSLSKQETRTFRRPLSPERVSYTKPQSPGQDCKIHFSEARSGVPSISRPKAPKQRVSEEGRVKEGNVVSAPPPQGSHVGSAVAKLPPRPVSERTGASPGKRDSGAAHPGSTTPRWKASGPQSSRQDEVLDNSVDRRHPPQGIPRLPARGDVKETRGARTLQVGTHTIVGRKPEIPTWTNQDALLTMDLPGGRLLACVFDGHGEQGHRASARARELFESLAPSLLVPGCGSDQFRQLFLTVHASLTQEPWCRVAGTTAACALIDASKKTATLAHVGDSGILLVQDGVVVHASSDHKFDPDSERRINASGGEVRFQEGGRRVFVRGSPRPGLACSRSLGDTLLSQVGVIAEPDVTQPLPFLPGSSIIIASDGVWDMVPPNVAAQVSCSADAQSFATSLAKVARTKWQVHPASDDITAVVVNGPTEGRSSASQSLRKRAPSPQKVSGARDE